MSPIRILLIEDNLDDAEITRVRLLREKSFACTLTHASRLTEGLAMLEQPAFDVVLTDLGLPDRQGLPVFAELHAKSPGLPIIILTGQNDLETALAAIKLGAQDFLPKSELTGFLLSRTIRYAIERKEREFEREKLIADLQTALAEVKTLSGMLPICGSCKKVRDDQGYWNQIETYIARHTAATFSHGLCPHCLVKEYEAGGVPVPESLQAMVKK
jgi:DNA-binding NtrC family response regulator